MVVTPKVSMAGPMILRGSTEPGRVKSISGMTAVMPRAGAKRAKSGKVGRSISPGLDAVELAQRLHLGGEVAVGVDRPLGRAGAAAGEEDRGDVVAFGRRQAERALSAGCAAR